MTTINLGGGTVRKLALGACLTALVATISCDSFLDPKPNDILAPENFYKSSTDAIAAVNGIYESNKWGHWLGYWYMTDVASDDINAAPNFGADGHRLVRYTFDATEGTIAGIWGGNYGLINRANAAIDRVPAIQMDETLKARLLGEARYFRASAYFDLVRFFGDVPLIDHEVKSLTGLEISRTAAADVYGLIISDLQAAIPALPASYSSADLGRVTSGAAQTLLAKVYLTKGDWANAAAQTGAIILSGQYELNAVWKDNFRIATEIINPESIFEVNYDGTLDPGAGSVMTLFSLPEGFPGGDSFGLMYLTPSLVTSYAANDQRGNHGTFMISPYTDALNRTATWSTPAGAAFDKYLDETSSQNMNSRSWVQQDNNWVVLRFADVLLMHAEAVNEGGPAGPMSAKAALDSVRTRAGIGPSAAVGQAALRDAIRIERRKEFVFEGHRWFDLSRWNILDAALKAKQTEMGYAVIGARSNLFPIPQSEMDINPKLTQNPGW